MASARTLALLTLTTAGLGLAVYLVTRPAEIPAERRLTGLDPAAVGEIRIERGARGTRLTRRDGGWWIDHVPEPVPADPEAVQALLAWVRAPVAAWIADGITRTAELGLALPEARLSFDATTLAIGADETVRGLRYVQNGERVGAIDGRWFNTLGGVAELADRRLIPEGAAIVALWLPELSVVRDLDGRWSTAPDGAWSQERLSAFITLWQTARADHLAEGELVAPGTQSVAVQLEDGRRLSFVWLPGRPQRLTRPGSGLVHTLPERTGDALFDLRAP